MAETECDACAYIGKREWAELKGFVSRQDAFEEVLQRLSKCQFFDDGGEQDSNDDLLPRSDSTDRNSGAFIQESQRDGPCRSSDENPQSKRAAAKMHFVATKN